MDLYDRDRNRKKASQRNREATPFLGIFFKCCKIYGRIYKDKSNRYYKGKCPKCGKFVTVPIGKNGEGTSSRFFTSD